MGVVFTGNFFFFFFKRKTAYKMRISDWSSDVCSSDLSAGHGSMLLYGLLHLTGYREMTADQLRSFRQWGALTAGHPEYGHTPGVETTTGPRLRRDRHLLRRQAEPALRAVE